MKESLSSQIIRLLRYVAETNRLLTRSKGIGDYVEYTRGKSGVGTSRIVQQTGAYEPDIWKLSDRDQQLWNEVVVQLCDLKKDVVSQKGAEKRLEGLIYKYKSRGWHLRGIQRDVEHLIKDLNQYVGEMRRVCFPIWGLVVKSDNLVIGDVEFRQRVIGDKIDELLAEIESSVKGSPIARIHSLAITQANGDFEMVVQNAEDKVNQSLNILRAFTYPTVTPSSTKQIGIMGTYYLSHRLYFIGDQDAQILGSKELTYGVGLQGVIDFVIDDYRFLLMRNSGFEKLLDALKPGRTRMQAKIVRGAEWIGEASKPDSAVAKFLKIAFAVDAMVGDESPDIPDKGKRARIAERTAFLLARRRSQRKAIYEEMRWYIGKRDRLAHGSDESVSLHEVEDFASYVRGLLSALVLREDPFKTIVELTRWVQHEAFKG